jgi:3-methyladenine DNA glycosylase AlkD
MKRIKEKQTAENVKKILKEVSSRKRAKINAWFFKTEKGGYGEGDLFLGVTVPQQRIVAKKYLGISFSELKKLLQSTVHEHRFTALLILVMKYEKANEKEKRIIARFYVTNLSRVNSWDLVDLSAPKILGAYYFQHGGTQHFYTLVKSDNVWKRRVAIIATYAFIREGVLEHTLTLSEMLLNDTEDLIQKATGWMLREVGKKDKKKLVAFLSSHSKNMPRTMLRYAIEKFPEYERKIWLQKESNIFKKKNKKK